MKYPAMINPGRTIVSIRIIVAVYLTELPYSGKDDIDTETSEYNIIGTSMNQKHVTPHHSP